MAEPTGARITQAVTGPPQRLVNLTEHEIVLDAQTGPVVDGDSGLGTRAVLRLPSDGRFARVDDGRARTGEDWLRAADDVVRLTTLRRSRHLSDLPASQPGTWYVVSRLTAHVARHRNDLVFPLGEIRDGDGRVAGARGLGVYRRGPAVSERYRDWRARAGEWRSRRSLPADWLTGVLFASGTALLSGAMGLLPGVLDNASKNGWAGGGQTWTTWLTVAFLVAGTVALGAAVRRWVVRQRMLGERGTAYVIEETAIHWRYEEKRSVLEAIASGFPSVLRVPGPGELGADWHWQADARGAPQWDARTDQLVHSFWSVYYNDNHVTRNAVFAWAPWPVAVAFAARATARRRGLILHVRQRPSGGAAGPRPELRLDDRAHDFLRGRSLRPLETAAPAHALVQACAQVTVKLRTLAETHQTPAAQEQCRDPESRIDAKSPIRSGGHQSPRLLLLLVRFVLADIGAIPVDMQQAEVISIQIAGSLAASVLPPGTYDIPVAEWRLTAGDECPGDEGHLPWPAFPSAADAIANWVEEQARAHPADVILLASRMPQEIAMGLGIQLGQRPSTWPRRVYPVHYANGHLIVPDLDLGCGSVSAERETRS